MAHPARFSVLALCCLFTVPAACGGGGDPAKVPLHDRLWVTAVPKKPSDTIAMLVIARMSESRQYGTMGKGSLLRGTYDTFQWQPGEDGHGKLRTLQDDRVHDIRLEGCEPDEKFQYCILVHGDPQGVVRYQSRKRWGLTRPKKGASVDLRSELAALAAEDEELAAVLAELPETP